MPFKVTIDGQDLDRYIKKLSNAMRVADVLFADAMTRAIDRVR